MKGGNKDMKYMQFSRTGANLRLETKVLKK